MGAGRVRLPPGLFADGGCSVYETVLGTPQALLVVVGEHAGWMIGYDVRERAGGGGR